MLQFASVVVFTRICSRRCPCTPDTRRTYFFMKFEQHLRCVGDQVFGCGVFGVFGVEVWDLGLGLMRFVH